MKYLLTLLLLVSLNSFAKEFKSKSSGFFNTSRGAALSQSGFKDQNKQPIGGLEQLIEVVEAKALMACIKETKDANKCVFHYAKIVEIKTIKGARYYNHLTRVTAEALYISTD